MSDDRHGHSYYDGKGPSDYQPDPPPEPEPEKDESTIMDRVKDMLFGGISREDESPSEDTSEDKSTSSSWTGFGRSSADGGM